MDDSPLNHPPSSPDITELEWDGMIYHWHEQWVKPEIEADGTQHCPMCHVVIDIKGVDKPTGVS
jgi:hypothetical protein